MMIVIVVITMVVIGRIIVFGVLVVPAALTKLVIKRLDGVVD